MKRTALVALCVVFSFSAAQAAVLQNGSFNNFVTTFETTNIPNWTVTTNPPFIDQSGVFFSVDGVKAQGGAMVLLTTGSKPRDPAPDVTTMTSDPFRVFQIRLEFQYVYATKQTESEALAGQDDPFTVTITRTSDNMVLYNQVIDSAANSDLVSSNISYGALTQGTGRPKLRQTEDWQWVVIDSSNWVGEEVTIAFTIQDALVDTLASGVFLDNVRNLPEPGSIVLFGLFGAGAGFAAWRRRRRSK